MAAKQSGQEFLLSLPGVCSDKLTTIFLLSRETNPYNAVPGTLVYCDTLSGTFSGSLSG